MFHRRFGTIYRRLPGLHVIESYYVKLYSLIGVVSVRLLFAINLFTDHPKIEK